MTFHFIHSLIRRVRPVPKEKPKPSYQGNDDTCTGHALGKAIVAGFMDGVHTLMEGENYIPAPVLDFVQKEIINTLIGQDKDPRWPKDFTYERLKRMKEKDSGKFYDIVLRVTEVLQKDFKDDMTKTPSQFKYVMVYRVKVQDPKSLHCVFVDHIDRIKTNSNDVVYCAKNINSWGEDDDPYVSVPLAKKGNSFWQVLCSAELKEIERSNGKCGIVYDLDPPAAKISAVVEAGNTTRTEPRDGTINDETSTDNAKSKSSGFVSSLGKSIQSRVSKFGNAVSNAFNLRRGTDQEVAMFNPSMG